MPVVILFLDTNYIILDLLGERKAKSESSAAHKSAQCCE